MPNNIEKIIVDYQKDKTIKKEILILSYYKNGILEYRSKPEYYDLSNKDLNYSNMLIEFKEQYKAQSETVSEFDPTLLPKPNSDITVDIDDIDTTQLSGAMLPPGGQIFVSYGWAASSALLAVLTASWPVIVAAGIVVAGCVTAYMLYDWIMTNVVSTELSYDLTYSASKHMADSLVAAIVNPNQTTPEVYFNPFTGTTLYVYDCGGFNGPINKYLSKDHGPYDFSAFNGRVNLFV